MILQFLLMNGNSLRGGDTPYYEARVSPPLKPHPFPARFRGFAPKNPNILYLCFFSCQWLSGGALETLLTKSPFGFVEQAAP
ncbi:MAG: hypothetical protein II397_07640, partial [Treponema sp.]|nr:hypothetical protein [Treponema sp.]